jgi:hypothetical protein
VLVELLDDFSGGHGHKKKGCGLWAVGCSQKKNAPSGLWLQPTAYSPQPIPIPQS